MAALRLTRERILEAAIQVIEAEGAGKFSMRKMARNLDVDPMAVYYYFPNKKAVLHNVLQHAMSEIDTDVAGVDWKQDIIDLCQAVRSFALKRSNLFLIFAEHDLWLRAVHDLYEVFYGAFLRAGLSENETIRTTRLILTFLEEFCYCEACGWHDLGSEEDYIETLEDGAFPLLRGMSRKTLDMDSGDDFEFSLKVLIAGIEAQFLR
jgi:AcrR family transcriptional regulator